MIKRYSRTEKEFSGSLFKQLRNCYEFLELCNHTAASFQGLDRIDKEDYPSPALREALLNAIVHRDYSFSGSIIINIFDDRMEFVSLGGLVSGLSKEDIMRSISQTRNQKLANVFYRLKHIVAYGTGIQRIFDLYAVDTVKPDIIITDNTFTTVLPNRNTGAADAQNAVPAPITEQERIIVDYVKKNGFITDEKIQSMPGIKKSRAYLIVKSMKDKNILVTHGRGNKRKHCLK